MLALVVLSLAAGAPPLRAASGCRACALRCSSRRACIPPHSCRIALAPTCRGFVLQDCGPASRGASPAPAHACTRVDVVATRALACMLELPPPLSCSSCKTILLLSAAQLTCLCILHSTVAGSARSSTSFWLCCGRGGPELCWRRISSSPFFPSPVALQSPLPRAKLRADSRHAATPPASASRASK